jgi:hypothetical protein
MDLSEARAFALSLPGATEEPHFELTSFRVRKKIFATADPEGSFLHVFVDEPDVRGAIALDAEAFEELWWGTRLCGVRAWLGRAEGEVVRDLLEDAWRRRASKAQRAAWDSRR